MRKTLILLAIALLPACNSPQYLQETQDFSQQEVTSQSATTKKNDSFEKAYIATSKFMIKKYDKNGDGTLSSDELKNNSIIFLFDDIPNKIVKEFDKNSDNLLSQDELIKALRYSKAIYFNETGMNQQIDMELKKSDKNGDGSLSYKEAFELFNWKGSSSPMSSTDLMINRYSVLDTDTNRDGKIDRDELKDLFALRFEAYYNLNLEEVIVSSQGNNNQNVLKIPFIKNN